MNGIFQSLPDAGYLTVSFIPNVFSVGLVGSMSTPRAPTIKEGLGSHKVGVYYQVSNLGTTEGKLSKYVCSAHAQDGKRAAPRGRADENYINSKISRFRSKSLAPGMRCIR